VTTPPLKGIHHVKLAVSDLDRALKFYETALGAQRLPQADHRHEADGSLYAYIVDVPGLGALLELRLDPDEAKKHSHFDSLTVAVEDRSALDAWDRSLTEKGIVHSPIIVAVEAWLIVIEDPDGNRLRLYTLEKHGRELRPDEGNVWLQY
jgi:catechol 2,3-dioxygenase-like lactoylglutathione lyase family enzyme